MSTAPIRRLDRQDEHCEAVAGARKPRFPDVVTFRHPTNIIDAGRSAQRRGPLVFHLSISLPVA